MTLSLGGNFWDGREIGLAPHAGSREPGRGAPREEKRKGERVGKRAEGATGGKTEGRGMEKA